MCRCSLCCELHWRQVAHSQTPMDHVTGSHLQCVYSLVGRNDIDTHNCSVLWGVFTERGESRGQAGCSPHPRSTPGHWPCSWHSIKPQPSSHTEKPVWWEHWPVCWVGGWEWTVCLGQCESVSAIHTTWMTQPLNDITPTDITSQCDNTLPFLDICL